MPTPTIGFDASTDAERVAVERTSAAVAPHAPEHLGAAANAARGDAPESERRRQEG